MEVHGLNEALLKKIMTEAYKNTAIMELKIQPYDSLDLWVQQ